jgi:hypothetical protein
MQASGEAPTGCFGHCTALDERRGRVLLLGQAGLFALSLETWVWERLGEAKEPWTLPHLGLPPIPEGQHFWGVPKGFRADVLHDRLVVMGGSVIVRTDHQGEAQILWTGRVGDRCGQSV